MPVSTPKPDDADFMMECLRHLTTPATVNGAAVAAALGYSTTASAATRIYKLKKAYGLNIIINNSEAKVGGTSSPAATTPKKRKGTVEKEASDDEVVVMETPSKKKMRGKKC